ncbi:MAG: hypothetical protein FWF04_05125 [Clostridiales bacterium]|nr:hypothetical protein [Clostridiales bacterium]
MKKIFLCLLIMGLLTVTACFAGTRLYDTDTRIYANEAGYHMTLPADWLLLEEEEESSIFSAARGDISLTVFNELGGEAYYGLDEITDMLLANLPETGRPWKSGRVFTDTDERRRQLFTNIDKDGAMIYLDITVLQPYPGIRYYLLFAAGDAAYSTKDVLLNDIIASFAIDENVESLYALMMARREKKLDEQTNEQQDLQPDEQPDEQPEGQQDEQPDEQPEGQQDEQPDEQPEGQQDEQL